MKTIVFPVFFEGLGLQKPKVFINLSLKNLSESRPRFSMHFYSLFGSNLDYKLAYFGALGTPRATVLVNGEDLCPFLTLSY